jgi:hypothetical protein
MGGSGFDDGVEGFVVEGDEAEGGEGASGLEEGGEGGIEVCGVGAVAESGSALDEAEEEVLEGAVGDGDVSASALEEDGRVSEAEVFGDEGVEDDAEGEEVPVDGGSTCTGRARGLGRLAGGDAEEVAGAGEGGAAGGDALFAEATDDVFVGDEAEGEGGPAFGEGAAGQGGESHVPSLGFAVAYQKRATNSIGVTPLAYRKRPVSSL